MKRWSLRFKKSTLNITKKYTCSINNDINLFYQDIKCTKIHCYMLFKIGILNKSELIIIIKGLYIIKKKFNYSKFIFSYNFEDIHLNIENILIKLIGNTAKKIRTARSRNDQIATDIKIWIKKKMLNIIRYLLIFINKIIRISYLNYKTIIPGYTHMQIAQPISLGHYFMCYFSMFYRDLIKLIYFKKNFNSSPLGSCALAGSNIRINQSYTSNKLNFKNYYINSIDGVSDRDYILDFLYINSLIMLHISKISEDIIIWMNTFYDFIDLPDEFCTGSSIMPQKKNPDIPEVSRARTNKVIGGLFIVFNIIKNIPLAYNKDMQEDKNDIFNSYNITKETIIIFSRILLKIKFNKMKMLSSLKNSFSTATDIADYLVSKGINFKDSHSLVSKLVLYCINKNIYFHNLKKKDLFRLSNNITKKININKFKKIININYSVRNKKGENSTRFSNVLNQIKIAKRKIKNILTKNNDI